MLAKGQPVRQVDLGPAQPIDEAVQAWRTAIVNRQASPAAEVVRRTVWEPLARHFPPGTTTVLIAPDGLLTAVPWAALPGDRPGTVLLEQYALATVPHAPFLLDRLTAPARSPGEGDLVLAVGGVDYDGTPKPVERPDGADRPAGPAAGRDRARPRARRRRRGWRSLPGTAREVEAVAKRGRPAIAAPAPGHRGQHGAAAPRAAQGPLGPHRHPRLLRRPQGPLDPPARSQALRLRGPPARGGAAQPAGPLGAGPGRGQPALRRRRAGRPSRDDLGIVTAEAIAGLPLQDLELVVLSACETGLGLVGGGEGVFGLQRAFHLAGAHNVVASLWKVDDEATAALMAIFYDQLWRQDKPPIEALRAAQLTLYHHPELAGELARARGTPDFDKLVQRPEPVPGAGGPGPRRADAKDWAAFVLSGWGR